MKPVTKNIEEVLQQCLPSAAKDLKEEIDALGVRVLCQLRAAADEVEDADEILVPHVSSFLWKSGVAASAAAAVLLVALIMSRTGSGPVVAQNLDGTLLRSVAGKEQVIAAGEGFVWGHAVHTNERAGATFVLADGSRVEMRAGSELALEQTNDGVRIRLSKGSVIVNAAKQRTGHLSVQTKDVAVSVIGTVFLVNAEEEGSRVAVIEGEVRVQHGTADKKLRRGEQVATGLQAEAQPVKEEISWSRNLEAHLALLQEPARAQATPQRGTLSGAVWAADGRPVSGIRVSAMRTDATGDELRALASLEKTDATGRYRLENIPPGTYYVTAGRIDLPTFHPGTLEIAKAAAVSISAGMNHAGIDVVLHEISTALPPTAQSERGHRVVIPADLLVARVKEGQVSGRRVQLRKSPSSGFVAASWTDEELARRLALTEDQVKQIHAIADRYLDVFQQNKTEFQRADGILKRMVAPGSSESAGTVSDQADRAIGLRRVWETANTKVTQEILDVLTDSQEAQLKTEKFANDPRLGGLFLSDVLAISSRQSN
jgi:hypothetical protein